MLHGACSLHTHMQRNTQNSVYDGKQRHLKNVYFQPSQITCSVCLGLSLLNSGLICSKCTVCHPSACGIVTYNRPIPLGRTTYLAHCMGGSAFAIIINLQ